MGKREDPGMLESVLVQLAPAPLWAAIVLLGSPEAAFAYFLASRMAYVSFTGLSLRAQDEQQWWSRRWGPEGGYRRFRRAVSVVMTNDGVALVIACWVGRGTLTTTLPAWVIWGLGACLIALGLGVKTWAVASIGRGAYYWKSFFIPPENSRYVAAGPYRWLENPMYTVGYAQAYGLALILFSVPGLIASLVAQSLILLFNQWAEKPHTERMRLRTDGAGDPGK